jgi:hypothetical protein
LRGLTAPSSFTAQPRQEQPSQQTQAAQPQRSEPQRSEQQRTMAYHQQASATAPAPKDSLSSMDMFEQSEFVAESASQKTEDVTLRGQTVDNAFIPPKPMEADMDVPENGVGSYISGYNAQHVPEEKKESGAGLHLNPPAKPAVLTNTQQQSRSPSLFERITGSVQHHIENLRDDGEMIKSNEAERTEKPSQGRLNIDTPSKPAVKIDDELDIPAFLRRQAN